MQREEDDSGVLDFNNYWLYYLDGPRRDWVPNGERGPAEQFCIAIEVVISEPLNLAFLPHRWRDDKTIVTMAVSRSGDALHFASQRLRRNKDLLALLDGDPTEFVDAIDEVESDPLLLSDLPHRWRDNKSIAVIAIAQRGVAIGSASQRLKENRALALLAAGHDDTGLVLGTMADHFRADKQIALAAVRGSGIAMVGIHEPLLHDKDIIAAASATFDIAQYLTPALRNDKDFILRIAKVCNPVVLGPALDAFVHDETFLQELLQITSRDRIALLRVTNLAGKSVMTSFGLCGVNVNYDGMVTYLGLDRLFDEIPDRGSFVLEGEVYKFDRSLHWMFGAAFSVTMSLDVKKVHDVQVVAHQ